MLGRQNQHRCLSGVTGWIGSGLFYRLGAEKERHMPTIEEVLIQTIEALEASGFTAGGAVYDDFAQAVKQLQDGDSVKERLTA